MSDGEQTWRAEGLELFDELPDAVVIADVGGVIRYANRHALRLFRAAELEGRRIEELMAPGQREAHVAMRAGYHAKPVARTMGQQRDLIAQTLDGQLVPVDIALNPISRGGRPHVLAVIRDATERRRHEDQRRIQEVALGAAANGIAILDRDGHYVWINPAYAALTGYTADELFGETAALLRVREQDREVEDRIWTAVRAGQAWRGELQRRRKDGTTYVEEKTITPVVDDRGVISSFVEIAQDVSVRHRAEEEQALHVTELELLHELGHLAEKASDVLELIRAANRLIGDNLGIDDFAIDSDGVTEGVAGIGDALPAAVARAHPIRVALRSGQRILGVARGRIPADDVAPVRWKILTTALTQLSVALERVHLIGELQQLATTDSLTGFLNRRALFARLASEIQRSRRTGAPLAVAMLDLDHFKRINDQLGHAAGDGVLFEVAARIRKNARVIDIIGRVGGEEFVVILPDTDAESARFAAERLRGAVSAIPIFIGAGSRIVTLSVGVSQLLPDEDASSLLSRADRALYEAKGGGRDRVIVATG